MKRNVLSSVLAMCFLLIGLAGIGCQSDRSNLPPGERGATAGGNGAFGEDPVRPGHYDNNSTGASTQPAGSMSP